MKNKVLYMENGVLIDSVTKAVVATTDDEESARYAAACINACLGLEVGRIELLAVLPMFLEMQRLRALVSEHVTELAKLRNEVTEYEKALASLDESLLEANEQLEWLDCQVDEDL